MVVVCLEPDRRFMDRAGMASGTRAVALRCGTACCPNRPREELVRELYEAENDGRPEPSGSQDMIGLIYPGVSRLDYDAAHEGGYFPVHVESNCAPGSPAGWSAVLQLVPVSQRPGATIRWASRTSIRSGSSGWGRAAGTASTPSSARRARARASR